MFIQTRPHGLPIPTPTPPYLLPFLCSLYLQEVLQFPVPRTKESSLTNSSFSHLLSPNLLLLLAYLPKSVYFSLVQLTSCLAWTTMKVTAFQLPYSFPHSCQSDLTVRTINKILSVGASCFPCLVLCYTHSVLQPHWSAFSSLKYHSPSVTGFCTCCFLLGHSAFSHFESRPQISSSVGSPGKHPQLSHLGQVPPQYIHSCGNLFFFFRAPDLDFQNICV